MLGLTAGALDLEFAAAKTVAALWPGGRKGASMAPPQPGHPGHRPDTPARRELDMRRQCPPRLGKMRAADADKRVAYHMTH